MKGSRRVLPFAILALALLVSGCRTGLASAAGLGSACGLEYPLGGLPGGEVLFNRQVLEEYADFAGEDGAIRLEQVFYGLGARVIDRIEIRPRMANSWTSTGVRWPRRPGTQQETEKITEVDGAVCRILDNLPSGTLAIIFADHGMHQVSGESRLGNHGNLVARDMLLPIWIHWIE